jgi:small-conductance mechanosensitive channel
MNTFTRVMLSILILLFALALGLLVRHLLLKQFKKASLGYALANAAGVSVIAILLLLAVGMGAAIITGDIVLLTSMLGLGMPGNNLTPLESLINVLWKVAITGVLGVLGLIIAGQIKAALERRLEQQDVTINLRTLIGRACYVLVLVATFFVVLTIWNVQIALPVAIISGVLTFALRDLIKDLVAGVFILADRPFQIGDEITISSSTGDVTKVSTRTTTLHLVTGEEMIIPNGRFIDQNVSNNTRYQSRRAAITAIFAEEAYVENETLRQLIQVIKGTEIDSDDRVPRITLNSATGRVEGFSAEKGGYSTGTITLTIRLWVDGSNRDAVTEVMEVLRKAFPHADFRVLEFAGNI